jgi:hypothetical protein
MANLSNSTEIWKDIPGYEGSYKVSSHGRIMTLRRMFIRSNGWPQTIPKKVLRPRKRGGKKKYLVVRLSKDQFGKNISVHRLVACGFIPNEENLPVVNHKDGNTQNNHVSNLEWATVLYNRQHAGSVLKAYEKYKKPINAFSISGTLLHSFDCVRHASIKLSVSRASITNVAKGRCESVKGWVFKYAI